MIRRIDFFFPHLFAILVASGMVAGAQNPNVVDYSASTVVLFNASVPESAALAKFYSEARGIPRKQVIGLKCPNKETITRDEFDRTIQGPLRATFDLNKWWSVGRTPQGAMAVKNEIRVLALMYGVPLRVAPKPLPPVKDPATGEMKPQKATAGKGDAASVDSELMRLGILEGRLEGPINNPYFEKDVPLARANLPMLMVTGRIDGPTPQDAKRLVTDALIAEATGLWGKVYVDLAKKTNGGYKEGEEWIGKAGQQFLLAGFPAVVDPHGPTFQVNYPMNDAAVYFGWYTGKADGPFLNPNFRFRKGAIAAHLHSYSATTLRSTSSYWVGPLINKGAAAVLGNVYEPYLALTTHFDVFAERLLDGYTLAESTAMATPAVSWMTLVVGDPLYRPFPSKEVNMQAGADFDYRTFRMAMQRWGNPKAKRELIKNLEKSAKKQSSGTLYEALGQLKQEFDPGKPRAASKYYDEAYRAHRSPADKLRVRLLQVDMVRRANSKLQAVQHLKDVVVNPVFAGLPELAAAKALLLQLDPPPPPAPAPKK